MNQKQFGLPKRFGQDNFPEISQMNHSRFAHPWFCTVNGFPQRISPNCPLVIPPKSCSRPFSRFDPENCSGELSRPFIQTHLFSTTWKVSPRNKSEPGFPFFIAPCFDPIKKGPGFFYALREEQQFTKKKTAHTDPQ